MNKIIVIGLVVLLIAMLLPHNAHSDQEPVQQIKAEEVTLTPVQYADKYTEQYGVDPVLFKKVMFCESSNNPKAVGDSGLAVSVMQYHRSTFDYYEKKFGEDLEYTSYQDQIKLASWMFSKGLQNNWSCYKIVTGA